MSQRDAYYENATVRTTRITMRAIITAAWPGRFLLLSPTRPDSSLIIQLTLVGARLHSISRPLLPSSTKKPCGLFCIVSIFWSIVHMQTDSTFS